MEKLGLKDSSRDLQVNCAISYIFYLYLMFHACAARLDVTGNLVKFQVFKVYVNKACARNQTCPAPVRVALWLGNWNARVAVWTRR